MFQAKSSAVLDRQNKVQKVSIPFTVTANATPASKTFASDEPSLLFFQFEDVDNCTEASGALAASETMPGSMATPADSTGTFIMLVKIGEDVVKVVNAKVTGRDAVLVKSCKVEGFTSVGQSAVVSCISGVNLASTDIDACLELEYTTEI